MCVKVRSLLRKDAGGTIPQKIERWLVVVSLVSFVSHRVASSQGFLSDTVTSSTA